MKPVRCLQTMLHTIGQVQPALCQVIPDGIYGENTRLAVTQIQKLGKLPVTGVTNLETWNCVVQCYREALGDIAPLQALELTVQPRQTVAPGEENLHLFLVQAMLTVICGQYAQAPRVSVNGKNDEKTQDSLRWLQSVSDLPETGVLNRPTWKRLIGLYRLTAGDGKLQK